MKIVTKNENETIRFGKKFAKTLKGGEVVLLIGDLGAGKTTFVKGVAQGLGIKKNITSPTFVLMKVYKVSSKDGRAYGAKRKGFEVKILVHLDTYRGLSLVDMENIGALEYFGENDTVCLVEWGEGLEDYLKKKEIKYRKVLIRNIDQNIREFNL